MENILRKIRWPLLIVTIGLFIAMFIFVPIVFYGFVGLMVLGAVYGGLMNRRTIKSQIDTEITKWRKKSLDEELSSQKDSQSQ